MGYPLFFGCLFIAYGPTAAIFSLSIASSPQLVILCIGSSFFWLLSVLAASILWYVIPPLQNWYWWAVFWSVIFQETMRGIFLKLYQRAEYDLVTSAKTSQLTAHPDILKAALSIGLGVGGTQALVNYITVLWQSMGDGSYYAPSCPSANLFILSAVYALCFTLLHIFWAVLAMLAFRLGYYRRLVGIGMLHMIASMLTLLNLPTGHCAATLVLLPLFVIGVGYLTYHSVLRSTTLTVSPFLVSKPLRRRKVTKKKVAPKTDATKEDEVATNDTHTQDPARPTDPRGLALEAGEGVGAREEEEEASVVVREAERSTSSAQRRHNRRGKTEIEVEATRRGTEAMRDEKSNVEEEEEEPAHNHSDTDSTSHLTVHADNANNIHSFSHSDTHSHAHSDTHSHAHSDTHSHSHSYATDEAHGHMTDCEDITQDDEASQSNEHPSLPHTIS